MGHGYVKSRAIVVLLFGAAGSGKTHFKELILNRPPPKERVSTHLAEEAIRAISICRATCTVGDEDMEWQLVTSEDLLRTVTDAMRSSPLTRFRIPMQVLPLDTDHSIQTHTNMSSVKQRARADYSDQAPAKQRTPTDESSSQASSNSAHNTENTLSHHSDTSTQDCLDLSEASEAQLKVLVDLISQSSGSQKLLDVDLVYIVDSGGQPQFHEILPAFVRYASACVFVTKLNEHLTDYPTIEYYDRGGKQQGTCYRSLLTHEQIMRHCFQILQSRHCISSSPQSGPMVFVAGMHTPR